MREIGGFIELSQFRGAILHGEGIALNCARNCLAYLIEAKKIKKIVIPKFLCNSVSDVCKKYDVKIRYYSINTDFLPHNLTIDDDEWLYLVNYYGQIDNLKITYIHRKYVRMIVDNVQAYFQEPMEKIDTLYSCRKYLGVPDGAFLFTDSYIDRQLDTDKSYDRMLHLMGRYEGVASDFYDRYIKNEDMFSNLPLLKMSKLTDNLLRVLDYDNIKCIRERNYTFLYSKLQNINKLKLSIPVGAFMYPLYIDNGYEIRKEMQKKGIYIPTLWNDVYDVCGESEVEYDMAKNILPLPCDQRYDLDDMRIIIDVIYSNRDALGIL